MSSNSRRNSGRSVDNRLAALEEAVGALLSERLEACRVNIQQAELEKAKQQLEVAQRTANAGWTFFWGSRAARLDQLQKALDKLRGR